MSKLNTLASRSNEQRKNRQTLAQKHAASISNSVHDKVLTPVTEMIHHNSKKKGAYTTTEVKDEMRESPVAKSLKARSKAAHQISEEVKHSRR